MGMILEMMQPEDDKKLMNESKKTTNDTSSEIKTYIMNGKSAKYQGSRAESS